MSASADAPPKQADITIRFQCDLAGRTEPLPHFWEHTVGSDHAIMALRADWQAQMRRAHAELGFGHVEVTATIAPQTTPPLSTKDRYSLKYIANQVNFGRAH